MLISLVERDSLLTSTKLINFFEIDILPGMKLSLIETFPTNDPLKVFGATIKFI